MVLVAETSHFATGWLNTFDLCARRRRAARHVRYGAAHEPAAAKVVARGARSAPGGELLMHPRPTCSAGPKRGSERTWNIYPMSVMEEQSQAANGRLNALIVTCAAYGRCQSGIVRGAARHAQPLTCRERVRRMLQPLDDAQSHTASTGQVCSSGRRRSRQTSTPMC